MLVSSGLVLVLSSVIVHKADSKVGAVRIKGVEGMEGEISFQLKVFDPVARKWKAEDTNYVLVVGNRKRDSKHKQRKKKKKNRKTENQKYVAVKANETGKSEGGWKPRDGGGKGAKETDSAEACLYLYPNQNHINTLLSAIMNRLTKLFVRLTKMLNKRRFAGPNLKTRFRIVEKRELFFERIFFNMTDDFRKSVKRMRLHDDGAETRDPCAHQDTIRALWVSLLNSSEECLGRAALSCIDDIMRTFRASDGDSDSENDSGSDGDGDSDSGAEDVPNAGTGAGAGAGAGGGGARGEGEVGKQAEARAAQLVHRELGRVRKQQLQALCNRFQLCYRDLQRPGESKLKNKTNTKSTPRPSPALTPAPVPAPAPAPVTAP